MARVSNHFHPPMARICSTNHPRALFVKGAVRARPASWQDLDSRDAAPVPVSEDTAPYSPRWLSMGIACFAPSLLEWHESMHLANSVL